MGKTNGSCARCGGDLVGHNQKMYCSIPCANAANVRRNKPRTCEICGADYAALYPQQRACARLCGYFLQHGRWPSSKVTARPDRDRPRSCAVPPEHPARWYGDAWRVEYRHCMWCELPLGWQSTDYHLSRTYCSDHCKKRMARARRESRQSATPEWQTWTLGAFMRMAAKFAYCCAYCGEKPERLDPEHVIPLAAGGKNTLSNLLPTCMPCNSDKRDLTLQEWATERRRLGKTPRTTTWDPGDRRYTHLTHPGGKAPKAA